ncbi:NAD(P)/FAD-dependent oxidoreductase [Denitrobaculum tricleocarpae]|uniref:FAD-binding oxidoreductase n=1 Tax=Denitrobaculum tricleocarpae TaxID=2591009 RepID=A0A545T7X8_9PROT|nr:FAD-dependent oxidoreductase [Denitrobaculum tricleocarpae]TQV73320.1 FAD-binding oxidoreductase [Denitrobaculum tricleocarpae]
MRTDVSETAVWKVTAPDRPAGSPLNEDLRCDVAVVGAGFTGLRAAIALAEAGSHVAVFDGGDVGYGASGRSGGQVNPMLPVARPEDLRAAVGDTYFERMAQVSLGSADELFVLVRKYKIDCDARQHGWLRADHSHAAREQARAGARAWNKFGAGFEFLEAEDTQRLSGSPAYQSATLSPRGGAVQPLALVRGLADVAESLGVRIYARSAVRNLERHDQRWNMTAAGQRVTADRVLLATNGYTDNLFKGLKRSILPLNPIQIATDPLGDNEIGPVLPEGHTISDTRRLIMYARREPDNRMVFGGIGYRKPFGGAARFNALLRDARRIFPSIRPESWRYRWSGQIAITDDRIPHFHEPAPGLVAGLGYNGRGVAMSLVMGRVLAERLLGAAPESLPLPVSPIHPAAFRNLQLAGASIGISAMAVRDRFEFR